MRRLAATALAFCLVATAPAAAAPPTADPIADKLAEVEQSERKPEKPARSSRRGRAEKASPPAAEPPAPRTPTLATLRGLTPEAVKAKLGAPVLERQDGAGALWTYRLPTCALLVFFADQGSGLKLVGAEAGPLVRGAVAPATDVCLAGAEPA